MRQYIKIHQSLIRKQLILGCEKIALRYLCALLGVVAYFAIKNMFNSFAYGAIALLLVIILWVVGLLFLQILARRDKQFFAILIRYFSYQKFYPAITDDTFVRKSIIRRDWSK
jgi:type IV secretory pathway TrbD component